MYVAETTADNSGMNGPTVPPKSRQHNGTGHRYVYTHLSICMEPTPPLSLKCLHIGWTNVWRQQIRENAQTFQLLAVNSFGSLLFCLPNRTIFSGNAIAWYIPCSVPVECIESILQG